MSTTDRAAFEQYAESQGCRDFEYDQDDSQRYRNPFTQREYKYWRAALAWQAEAAKATGTAGEQEPWQALDFGDVPFPGHWVASWPVTQQRGYIDGYRAAVKAEAARQPAPVELSYLQLLAIADDSEAHEALQGFSEDPTQDNGVCVVRAILKAATNRSQP